jgi:hypothetical protein
MPVKHDPAASAADADAAAWMGSASRWVIMNADSASGQAITRQASSRLAGGEWLQALVGVMCGTHHRCCCCCCC